ncbi:hypothetical protein D9758_009381 [Tetrapyrgos nigripes]|uniref:Oxidase ustYa n=1 Tax=Tetrapyrgos nigripes TaxID=182062 RepID=A0A8H5D244_9AGAR|nr:hypothetical protein D9758_009381 [Tetrapyrgos nigripes]
MFSMPSVFKVEAGSHRVAAIALGLSLVGNLFVLLYQTNIIFGVTTPKYTYIDADHPRNLPLAVRPANMVFKSNLGHFGMGKDPKTWAEWSTLRPVEAGYLFLGQTYLPIGLSMWHQYHCLDHIRALIALGDDGSDHTEHCFHYIRASILCGADSTLEPRSRRSFDVEGNEIFPGDGVTHTCRDFQQIYDWTMEQRKGWSQEQVDRFGIFGTAKHGSHEGGTNTEHGMHEGTRSGE